MRTVAITAYQHTVGFLTKAGRFRQAADRNKDIAKIYETDKQDLAKASQCYEIAGEWYKEEDSKA